MEHGKMHSLPKVVFFSNASFSWGWDAPAKTKGRNARRSRTSMQPILRQGLISQVQMEKKHYLAQVMYDATPQKGFKHGGLGVDRDVLRKPLCGSSTANQT